MVASVLGDRALAQVDGAALFELSCSSCHSASKGEPNKLGPNLHGVVGRASGSAPGFEYSPALASGRIQWSEQALDGFLASPAQAAPGTAMMFMGLAESADRAQVVAYLRGLDTPPNAPGAGAPSH